LDKEMFKISVTLFTLLTLSSANLFTITDKKGNVVQSKSWNIMKMNTLHKRLPNTLTRPSMMKFTVLRIWHAVLLQQKRVCSRSPKPQLLPKKPEKPTN